MSDEKPKFTFNFTGDSAKTFNFGTGAPKPAAFSFGNVGTTKFEFAAPKAAETEKVVKFAEIKQKEQEIISSVDKITYYILTETKLENGEKQSEYVKGEPCKLQLVKDEDTLMIVARIQISADNEEGVKKNSYDKIVFHVLVKDAKFEFSKFLKATGPNLVVRTKVDKVLKPVIQTFLFKGEGLKEFYEKVQE